MISRFLTGLFRIAYPVCRSDLQLPGLRVQPVTKPFVLIEGVERTRLVRRIAVRAAHHYNSLDCSLL